MKIDLLAFGIAKDILGYTQSSYMVEHSISIADLKKQLSNQFPSFEKLSKFDIAVNQEYQSDDFELSENDEVAIIPPVSGG
ncbi:MoaD/ThiS family protein [Portibacter lacus]|uniref:Molybdopterin synthase sulfur carrier subunit n=1 Tax=Portibacter lacus TaxID=1099794 RepID=A0AA37WDI6_9BACT|nr:MoaD/ThiS family protein [Portibacter lacus]GLR17936.1 molybdopterin converting factor small subunit [Portibacter lacus]